MEPQNTEKITTLPGHFVDGLNKSVGVLPEDSKSPVEEQMKQKAAEMARLSQAKQLPTMKIGDHEIYADANNFFMYLVAAELSKTPSIDKILKEIKFKYADIHDKAIYPLPEPVKTPKRKKK